MREFGVVANVISDGILRRGAKVYLLWFWEENVMVYGLTKGKGGRKVDKVIPFKRLTRFRAAWFPEHVRARPLVGLLHETKDGARKVADDLGASWPLAQFYDRSGRMKRPGLSMPEVRGLIRRRAAPGRVVYMPSMSMTAKAPKSVKEE